MAKDVVGVIGGVLTAFLILSFLALSGFVIITRNGDSSSSPTPVYESFVTALETEEWSQAIALLAPDCDITAYQLERVASSGEMPPIGEMENHGTYVAEDGESVLIWLGGRRFQRMVRVDGEWLLSCEGLD